MFTCTHKCDFVWFSLRGSRRKIQRERRRCGRWSQATSSDDCRRLLRASHEIFNELLKVIELSIRRQDSAHRQANFNKCFFWPYPCLCDQDAFDQKYMGNTWHRYQANTSFLRQCRHSVWCKLEVKGSLLFYSSRSLFHSRKRMEEHPVFTSQGGEGLIFYPEPTSKV